MRNTNGFFDICNRETGQRPPRRFARQFSANQGIVQQLDMYAELRGQNNCVGSMDFNSSGDLLVSGSDDKQVIFWNWETKTRILSYGSGHLDQIYQTKIMPLTTDQRIVTACGGGQVRLGEVLEDGQVHTKRLGSHRGRQVHKLAVEPGNPNIVYSCGDDSYIQHFDLRSNTATKLFRCCKFTKGAQHPLLLFLYDMVFDPSNPNHFCLGGNDASARVYDIRNCWQDDSSRYVKPVNTLRPAHLIHTHYYMITGLAYSNSGELLVSYADEHIYLFEKNMVREEMARLNKPKQFVGHRNASPSRVSFFGPNDEYVLSGSYGGHMFIWKKKGGELVRVMTVDSHDVQDIQPHPHNPVIATRGSENILKLWAPMAKDDASPLPDNISEIMEFNRKARSDFFSLMLAYDDTIYEEREEATGIIVTQEWDDPQ